MNATATTGTAQELLARASAREFVRPEDARTGAVFGSRLLIASMRRDH